MAATSVEARGTERRRERRVSVRLPMRVKGTDERGVTFEESTASENVCRSGAAFLSRHPLPLGADLEIIILTSAGGSAQQENSFLTRGRVVHIEQKSEFGANLVGVLFIGSRFNHVFVPESA